MSRVVRFVFVLIISSLLLTGCGAIARLNKALYPTPTEDIIAKDLPTATTVPQEPTATHVAKPSATAKLSATALQPAPTTGEGVTPTLAATSTPAPLESQSLVFAVQSSLYVGDLWGQDAQVLGTLPRLEAWDFSQGRLASTRGWHLMTADVRRGAFEEAILSEETVPLYSQVLWGASGQRILHVAVMDDSDQSDLGPRLVLRQIAADGLEIETSIDLAGVANNIQPLHYQDADETLLCILRDAEGEAYVARVALSNGQISAILDNMEAKAETGLSPDGRRLLSQRLSADGTENALLIYDLESPQDSPARLPLPDGAYAASPIWSNAGDRVAYLLQSETGLESNGKGASLYVLDMETMQSQAVAEGLPTTSSLMTWMPGDQQVIGFSRKGSASHYYSLRLDGGEMRILALPAEAQILGWTPLASQASLPSFDIDLWKIRFVDSLGDSDMTAQTVANYIRQHPDTDTETLRSQIAQYLSEAGWQADLTAPDLLQVAEGSYLAQLPSMNIYWLQDDRVQRLATGDLIQDARLDDDRLGLIYGTVGASAVQPAFALYHRASDDSWELEWTPQGQRAWVATDGEIRFRGDDLEKLLVEGSSFGLDSAVFVECHACPHRTLTAEWIQEDGAYSRVSDLPSDAPLEKRLWEMSQPSPYAVTYEVLRRLRAGEATGDLVADATIVDQISDLGLLDPTIRLIPDQEETDGLFFSLASGEGRYYAAVEDGALVSIESLPSTGDSG